MRVLAAVLLAAIALLSGRPSPARACGVAWCTDYAAPIAGSTIPANAPALVQYIDARNWHGATVGPRARLLGPDGAEITLATRPEGAGHGEYLLVPAAALVPGEHVLIHGACSQADARNGFMVGPEVPLPASIGTVRLEPLPVEAMSVAWEGGCGWQGRASSVRIVLEPSREMQAWLALARFTLDIDGKSWQASAYGTDRAPNFAHPNSVSVFRPYTTCDPSLGSRVDFSPAVPAGSIPPGRHRARLSVRIAGAPADPPPLEFDLVTTCGDVPDGRPAPGSSADAGSSDAAAGHRGAGGCAVAVAPAAGGGNALVGMVLFAIGAAWRRARRRS